MTRAGTLVALGAAGCACADIVPLEGLQTTRGHVEVFVGGMSQGSQTFNLNAPSAVGSWSPAPQDIQFTSLTHARVQSSYVSTISSSGVSLHLESHGWSTGNLPTTQAGQFEWEHIFNLRFSVTSPGDYFVSAEITRSNVGGWGGLPTALSFGPEGQPAIVELTTPSTLPPFPTTYAVSFGPTSVHLKAGVYSVAAFDEMFWGGFRDHELIGSMRLSILEVPSPAGVLVLAVGAVRRRRR